MRISSRPEPVYLIIISVLPLTANGGSSLLTKIAFNTCSPLELQLEILVEEAVETLLVLPGLNPVSAEQTAEVVIVLHRPT